MTWDARVALRGRRRERAEGQSLAEFALLIPLFLLLVIGLIEFALAFSSTLNVNYASRAGGLAAAQAGNAAAADCLILAEVERTFTAPSQKARVTRIEIQRTNASGSTVHARSVYDRSGSTTCALADGTTISVPYRATSAGYPPSQRCNILPPSGCPTMTPPRTTVDTIAVEISYSYQWQTPLRSVATFFGGGGGGGALTIVQRNAFRMEPIL
jgi:Flp pilus assembly protein TadG